MIELDEVMHFSDSVEGIHYSC